MASGELTLIVKRMATEQAAALEGALTKYRALCSSDEEFTQRTWANQYGRLPNTVQYFFDGAPVFYTLFEFKDNKFIFSIHPG